MISFVMNTLSNDNYLPTYNYYISNLLFYVYY